MQHETKKMTIFVEENKKNGLIKYNISRIGVVKNEKKITKEILIIIFIFFNKIKKFILE